MASQGGIYRINRSPKKVVRWRKLIAAGVLGEARDPFGGRDYVTTIACAVCGIRCTRARYEGRGATVRDREAMVSHVERNHQADYERALLRAEG